MRLYLLALLCICIKCPAQNYDSFYEKPLKKHNVIVSIGANSQLLPPPFITDYQAFTIKPQISLGYQFNYKMVSFEPEIILRSNLIRITKPSDLMPNCSICYTKSTYKGSSFHLILPLTFRYKRIGVSIGANIELPSIRNTLDTADTLFGHPPTPIRFLDWQMQRKPIFGFYFGLQYNVKRYQFRISDMTKKYLYDTYARKPQIVSLSLGYRL